MSELKNKFGDNLAWLLSDVAEQVKCSIEESDDIESSFEIWGETEDGREARCDVDLVDILESAQAVITEKDKAISELKVLVESAFREGYSLGYGDGNSDGQSYCGKPCRDDELQWKLSDAIDELDKHKQSKGE